MTVQLDDNEKCIGQSNNVTYSEDGSKITGYIRQVIIELKEPIDSDAPLYDQVRKVKK